MSTTTRDRRASDGRRAWIIGGVLLIGSVAFGVIVQPVTSATAGTGLIGVAFYSASLLVFAFGIRGSGSVTARRPLGTTAMTVLATWVLLASVVSTLLLATTIESDTLLVMTYVDSGVRFVAALVAVTAIARAETVARPWNWAAGWALAAVSITSLLPQVLAVGGVQGVGSTGFVLGAIDGLVRVGAALFLGVLAIILANLSGRARTTVVYPGKTSRDE